MGQRLWAVLFTGIPFGVFKLGGGVAAYEDIHPILGWLVMGWGTVDILLNFWSLLFPKNVAVCFLSNVGRLIDRRHHNAGYEQILLAVDTLLAFTIVASMIWFARINDLPSYLSRSWELAVIASVMGVGMQRVWRSIRQRRGDH